ncbi:protein-L-isoaspartate(D-aspartate) O-methyltransferase [Massilia sp. Leaf139]|uniref:protein-L-isoaspartate(D-aspartate) O-methyltransferase n=1 Tax=Massilia sp. Leaf139 TaxID=1736272 RepID=UPI0006F3B438|nr:protein-L-isoaspartate(D-aspartate) O-methyltransferase [Massilia sp. Leaf139]KQQ96647.1 protein-L-isoaspartate O-methyltransferase [Massilia sp. Leaf139]
MSDRSNPPGRGTFPLPLSSVTGGGARKSGTQAPVATPQTATRNAAHAVAGAQAPKAPQPGPKLPGYAASTTQSAPTAQRSDLMATEAIRRAMVTRVANQGVRDQVVLAALDAVPRHLFIEPALSSQAYIDASLPIGHHQTISQPYIVARMIEAMRDGKQLNRVLEIGTGCGYQAAVLARVAQDVYSIERIKPLHELAKANLRSLRLANLRLHYGDGMLGLAQVAPFDGIILAAAGMEVPRALLEQLAIGARLVAPVGGQVQHLQRITRTGKSEWISETLEACHFVPLRPGTA